jgi:hypothetical protein
LTYDMGLIEPWMISSSSWAAGMESFSTLARPGGPRLQSNRKCRQFGQVWFDPAGQGSGSQVALLAGDTSSCPGFRPSSCLRCRGSPKYEHKR